MIKYSILIPVNIDHEMRGKNLRFIVEHLKRRLSDVEIIIGEMGPQQLVPDFIPLLDIKYIYYRHDIFDKSLLLNTIARMSDKESRVLVLHNADIFLMPEAYETAYRYIVEERYDAVYPYAYYNNSEALALKEDENDSSMENIAKILGRVFPSRAKGMYEGIVFIHKDVFWDAGGENEYLIGHSHEDLERFYRLSMMGYAVRRIPGEVYHLYHPKTVNTFFENNAKEYAYVSSRSKQDLKAYTRTWQWACGLTYLDKNSNRHKKLIYDRDRLQNIGDVNS